METVFSERFRRIRKAKGLTLEQMANLLDCSTQTVYNLEKDKLPGFKMLKKIGERLEVDLHLLVTNQEFQRSDNYNNLGPAVVVLSESQPAYARSGSIPHGVPLPWAKEGNKRTFEVFGDRMAPKLQNGDFVLCHLVDIGQCLPGQVYVVVLPEKGIIIGRLNSIDVPNAQLEFSFSNADFPNVSFQFKEVRELWSIKYLVTPSLDHNAWQEVYKRHFQSK